MRRSGRSAYGRTAKVALGVAGVGLLTTVITLPGSAQTPPAFGPGTGSAIALVYKVNPIFGNLSFGITAGESVAGHQNTGAQAQSKAINLGVIGVTLAGEGCEGADPTLPSEAQPQPVIVSTDDPGSETGRTETLGGAVSMSAQANKDPFSRAVTTVAPLGAAAGLSVAAGTATATSGVVAPGVRQAQAVTDIAEIKLFGGLITLNGLHWEATQRTGEVTENEASFSLGSIKVGMNTIPLPNEPLEALGALKDVLAALGLTITAPTTRVEEGIVFVDPLKIGIIPSVLRDTIVGGVLDLLTPVREALVDFINSIGCGAELDILGNNGKTAVTVLDLALGAISGAGSLTVELGGVQATTAEITGFSGLGQAPVVPDLPSVPQVPAGSGLPLLPSSPARPGPRQITPTLDEAPLASAPVSDEEGDRGGVLLGVAGAGLLLLLATAEADRRKMVRAQREISMEA